jgi:DNA polymerase III epsilon subunit-like protein
MLSIGACLVDRPEATFNALIRPISEAFDPDALAVTGMPLEQLKVSGRPPEDAMAAFANWVEESAGSEATPVFVGFNAPFDWSFVNYYFHRFLGSNPFGFTALDIKALYMGATGCAWRDTRSSRVAGHLKPKLKGDHDALHDALYQAELFRLIRNLTTLVRV